MNRQREAAGVGASAAGQSSGAGCIAQNEYNTAKMARQPKHGRVSGGVWRKTVRASIHQLRKPKPAWALDVADLEAARRCGAKTIEITDQETGVVYTVTVDHFMAHASRFNRGAGEQAALPSGFWQRSGADAPAGDAPRQLSFAAELGL